MATDDHQEFYADWLTRLAGVPKPRRAIMLARAASGRFQQRLRLGACGSDPLAV